MSYLFHTDDDRREMLAAIGASSIDEIINDQVPQSVQLQRQLELPPAIHEMELTAELTRLADRNANANSHVCFLGGGAYDHFIPAVVDEIASRGEYYTSYTPYQAEVSQGNLQVMFEYETLITQLTGLGVSNASLYDGGSAATEAVLMALATQRGRNKVITSDVVHPQYREILAAYLRNIDAEIVVVAADENGCSAGIIDAIDDQTACVLVQHPNFIGGLEDVAAIAAAAKAAGALTIESFDPVSLGRLRRPGDMGVDIAVAEGQGLGNPLAYGGPYLGIMACREDLVRRLPGRIAGQTTDRRGKRCWVLTLQTREQHIRREKATSNICSNQTLLALRATVHLSLLGPEGLRETSDHCIAKTEYAKQVIVATERFEIVGEGPSLKEFVVRDRNGDVAELLEYARNHALLAGIDLGPMVGLQCEGTLTGLPDRYRDCFLVAVTEKRTRAEIDQWAEILCHAPQTAAC
ncbi:aminomethyl-transferring glycine dehydrogenase subunit GcvPA [Allorhodopirellula solitaria]|uniref:Probable glycine dehydrogenase (decarboxylating) subunit 1 n=1 Tax=Allorhodopirellula solitaria TaxID=2527987 RepID=A0A5C5YJF6_9BACT|nr:aminomethyl-transferring glycine dehydrogenase subunit GcvPA [Allorhodopirellula solitaria]TWT75015.1 putative glycine dehydrogenase (decarboxylating) subunit 1 [Allorhodopirellula solitaria]